jgi:ABC-type transport system involved in multi-copper enzyme maturation permease subunit
LAIVNTSPALRVGIIIARSLPPAIRESMSGSFLVALGPPWMSLWLTPVWIVGVGALLGLAVLLVLWGLVAVFSRRAGAGVLLGLQEGPLWPIFIGTAVLAAFGGLGWVFATKPADIMQSLARYPVVGTQVQTFDIPAPRATGDGVLAVVENETPVDVSFLGRELREIRIRSNQNLEVGAQPRAGLTTPAFDVRAGETLEWRKTGKGVNPFPDDRVEKLYVRNLGDGPAQMELTVVSRPEHAEAIAAPITALIVIAIFLLYMLQRAFFPKLSAVALSTAKSEMAQPLYGINLIVGIVLLWLFIFIPYYTLGEDIKMLKNSGLTLIMVLCIIQAIWAASNSIADEIEGRTALTVLSKPLSRWQFIVGKYSGIMWATAVMFLAFSVVFLLCVAYKPIYDSREGGPAEIVWQLTHYEMVQTVPGLALAFMEVAVLAAISVAISTRLPMIANFILCFSIYVLGHLTPLMVQSAVVNEAFEPVVFVGRLIATVFPVLENLNIQAAIAGGQEVPLVYLGWALVYSTIYGVIAMLLALALFEDRDLA